jgi:N-formylglutamate amidohydrolase
VLGDTVVPDVIWTQQVGDSPLVAVAVHNGHALRDELLPLVALSDAERLREEDPFTGRWTAVAPTRLVGLRSRFEVDLNRPPELAVYRRPEDAWGLTVCKRPLPEEIAARSLAQHAAFYRALYDILQNIEQRYGRFVVYDLHSYNHRRGGPDAPPDDPEKNPQVNVGTGTMVRAHWAAVVERFIADLRAFDFPGGRLDVRENIRFFGGYLPRWVHEAFPETGCALAIEVKKFFMDEWTGEPFPDKLEAVEAALQSTVPGVLEMIGRG